MSTKIDFNNKTHITYIIISIIILFGIVYVWKNCNCNKDIEAFIQYNVSSSDSVTLNSLGNVVVGNNGKTLDDILDTSYYKINTGKTLEDNTQKKITDLSTNITTTNTAFTNEINQKIQNLTQNMDDNIQKLTQNMDSNIQTLTQNMDDNIPELLVSAYYKTTAPTGWQICDGTQLKAMDGTSVYYKTSTTGPLELKTPDLRGRSILGFNPNGALTKTKLGDKGGEEKHTITINEMPSHNHETLAMHTGDEWCTTDTSNFRCGGTRGNKFADLKMQPRGGSQSHNNVHPVYVLNYIIKQPKFGGTSSSTNVITMPVGFINPTTETIFTS